MLFHCRIDMVKVELGWSVTREGYARYLLRVDAALRRGSWSARERCGRREGLLLDGRRGAAWKARLSLVLLLLWMLCCRTRLGLLLIPGRLLRPGLMLVLLALERLLWYPSICLSSRCRCVQCVVCVSILLLVSRSNLSVSEAHGSHLPGGILRTIAIAGHRGCSRRLPSTPTSHRCLIPRARETLMALCIISCQGPCLGKRRPLVRSNNSHTVSW